MAYTVTVAQVSSLLLIVGFLQIVAAEEIDLRKLHLNFSLYIVLTVIHSEMQFGSGKYQDL